MKMNNLKKYKITIEGVTPIIMHNYDAASPFSKYMEERKSITSKGSKKSDEQVKRLSEIQFLESLYFTEELGLFLPSENIQRMLLEACRRTEKLRESRMYFSGISEIGHPLGFSLKTENCKDIQALLKDPKNKYTKMVVIQKNRVSSVRAIFNMWECMIEVEIDTETLNPAQLEKWFCTAGKFCGLGARRPSGPTPGLYGRFIVTNFKEVN